MQYDFQYVSKFAVPKFGTFYVVPSILFSSSLKLVYIFTVNAHLGPLQISLGRMILDILKFFFFVVLVLLAFGCGINQLYWYYSDSRQRNCDICLEAARTQYERDRCDCDTTLAKWVACRAIVVVSYAFSLQLTEGGIHLYGKPPPRAPADLIRAHAQWHPQVLLCADLGDACLLVRYQPVVLVLCLSAAGGLWRMSPPLPGENQRRVWLWLNLGQVSSPPLHSASLPLAITATASLDEPHGGALWRLREWLVGWCQAAGRLCLLVVPAPTPPMPADTETCCGLPTRYASRQNKLCPHTH